METKTALSEHTLSHIRELIEINNDSAAGFRRAAQLTSPPLSDVMAGLGQQRRAFASELSALAALNRQHSEPDGSWKGRVHRWWLELRSKVQPNQTSAILAEAERGEATIQAAYESTLRQSPATAIGDVLHRQLEDIRKARRRVQRLRAMSH